MPIAMSSAEWARIVRWTDPNKEDPEVARQRAHVKRLDDVSTKMTRDWPNSLENVNKRNEELRRARIEIAEQANSKFYKRYVKRKREEQQRLMYSARDTIFKNKDAPKLLLSAVIETVIQKERAVQKQFNEDRRKAEEEQKKKEDAEIIRKAAEWHALQAERSQKRFQVNKEHQKEILEQAHEVAERARKDHEDELNHQRVDNIQAALQMEELAEFEAQFKADEKARIWAAMKQSKEEADQRKAEAAARDRLDDELSAVLQRSRARTEAQRTHTEKEIKAEKLRVLEKISKRLESGEAARDAFEAECCAKAAREKEAIAEKRLADQRKKQQDFVESRKAARAKFLEDKARADEDETTRRQWDIVNRFKNVELYEEFQEQLRKEKERKIKEFREDTLRLWQERDEREARERAETRHFYGELAMKKLRDADNKLLTHATALVEEARQHSRPERPLLRAVDRYCKLYRLYPMPDLPSSMAEHFEGYAPWDGSAPDAGYRAPPAPPPDRGPDAPDDEDITQALPGKRDGLQTDTTVVREAAPAPPQQSVADCGRAGRADGLQRRNAETDLVKLPPIATPGPSSCCPCSRKPQGNNK